MGDLLINMQLEKIAALKREKENNQRKIANAEHALKGLVFDHISVPSNKARYMNDDNRDIWPKDSSALSLSEQDCDKSPTGKCVTVHTPDNEMCLFCGKPAERK